MVFGIWFGVLTVEQQAMQCLQPSQVGCPASPRLQITYCGVSYLWSSLYDDLGTDDAYLLNNDDLDGGHSGR